MFTSDVNELQKNKNGLRFDNIRLRIVQMTDYNIRNTDSNEIGISE